jgi:hypothetical protein
MTASESQLETYTYSIVYAVPRYTWYVRMKYTANSEILNIFDYNHTSIVYVQCNIFAVDPLHTVG